MKIDPGTLKITDIRSDRKLNTEELKKKAGKVLKVKPGEIKKLAIIKESIDARHKDRILYIYSVEASVSDEGRVIRTCRNPHVTLINEKSYSLPIVSNHVSKSIL